MVLPTDVLQAPTYRLQEKLVGIENNARRLEFDDRLAFPDGIHLRRCFFLFFTKMEFYHYLPLRKADVPLKFIGAPSHCLGLPCLFLYWFG